MMINLKIPNNGELRLEFDGKAERFSICRLIYENDGVQIGIYEDDYLYFFVENMLGRLEKIPRIEQGQLFGAIGQWQEYYLFEADYVERYAYEIEMMERSIFFSAERYGIFLYEFDDAIWIEIDKGYDERKDVTPAEYYSDSSNYRFLLAALSKEILSDWRAGLEKIKKRFAWQKSGTELEERKGDSLPNREEMQDEAH